MAHAIESLLAACGLDTKSADLQSTPLRVARLWLSEFLSGYDKDPSVLLGNPVTGEADPDLVLVEGLRFHALCPHHLLPYRGVAHVGYQPRGKLAGFGRIAELVECFAHRLTLQERMTHEIAQAMVTHLGATGAGCVIVAEQLCLALPGERHDRSAVTTSAFIGTMAGREDLKARLLARSSAP